VLAWLVYLALGAGGMFAVWIAMTGGFFSSFTTFVARRYLMVRQRRVSRRVYWLIASGIGARILSTVAYTFFGPFLFHSMSWHNPLWWFAIAADIFLNLVVAIGVLRYSKPALIFYIAGLAIGFAGIALNLMTQYDIVFHYEPDELPKWLAWTILLSVGIGFGLAGLAIFFGILRASFTFFTTVPIGGVWIGTAALVCVLSVMSGFENDLRDKILGSNAHIQVTREDGEMSGWRDVKARIDKIPGVVATTPYATSEVVIAANTNGQNVIIDGIDPMTVGNVTELVRDLEPIGNPIEQIETLRRLEPIIKDAHDLSVKPATATPKGKVVDPPPSDMPSGGDPIDYTQPVDNGSGSAGAGSDGTIAPEPPPEYVPEVTITDPPPTDLITTDDPPIDYSQAGSGAIDPTIHVIDIPPPDQPILSRRTQALPGILVGRELVKQTHLYTGEEVRVVSPLSDPSNPDATGTPIPFNRDYRVAGIFFTGMYEYDLKHVYVTLDSLDEFLDRGDTIDGIEVRIGSPDDTDEFVKTIGDVLGPQYRVQDWKELNRSLFSALKLEKIAMFLVLGIVILVASFSIVGNLIMVVVEKAREIALLKTLGASDVRIMHVFAIQGLMIGLVGTVLGILTGLAACVLGERFGIPLNPDVYYIDRMPIHVEMSSVAVTAAAGVLISLAATLYPALVAARVRPAAGMRH
jgi:lipoprotein-releasing system permease protein